MYQFCKSTQNRHEIVQSHSGSKTIDTDSQSPPLAHKASSTPDSQSPPLATAKAVPQVATPANKEANKITLYLLAPPPHRSYENPHNPISTISVSSLQDLRLPKTPIGRDSSHQRSLLASTTNTFRPSWDARNQIHKATYTQDKPGLSDAHLLWPTPDAEREEDPDASRLLPILLPVYRGVAVAG